MSAVQNRPPSRDTWSRSRVAYTTRSGWSGEMAIATPGPRPAPDSRQVRPPSFDTTSGGPAVDDGDDRGAWRSGSEEEREIDLGRCHGGEAISGVVDDLVPRRGRPRPSRSRSPPGCWSSRSDELRRDPGCPLRGRDGLEPRRPRVEIDEREHVTGARRVDRARSGVRSDRRGYVGRHDERAARAESEHDLGHAERPQRIGARDPPARILASSSFSFRTARYSSVPRSTPASRSSGPRRAIQTTPWASSSRRRPSACQRRQRVRREMRPKEPGDEHPSRLLERPRCPAFDVPRGPRVADRVDRHHAVVTLVVEAERRRLPRVDAGHGKARRPSGARAVSRWSARNASPRRRPPRRARPPGRRGRPRHQPEARRRRCDRRPGCRPARGRSYPGRTGPTRRIVSATASARANDTTKLGSVAPIPHAGGSRRSTWPTHQAGPVGESHWYAANPATQATIAPTRTCAEGKTSSGS